MTSPSRTQLLGRHVQHDPRSRAFPARTAAAPTLTKVWGIPPLSRRLDQGQMGSCTGNAAAQWRNSIPGHKPYDKWLTEPNAVSIYTYATQHDNVPGGMPGQDTGSTGIAAAQALVALGFATSYTHAFGFDHALAALEFSPVMFGTDWTEGMFDPDARGFVTPSGKVEGGHEYLVYGRNMASRYLWCLNSWSNWGLGQRFKMSFDTAEKLLGADGDVTVPVLVR